MAKAGQSIPTKAKATKPAVRRKGINTPQSFAFNNIPVRIGQKRRNPTDGELLYEYATNGTVYACVNLNAKSVACSPYHLYRRTNKGNTSKSILSYLRGKSYISEIGEVEEITDHPALDALRTAIAKFNLLFLTSVSLDVLGRSYWNVESSPLIEGQPDLIYPLLAQFVLPLPDSKGFVAGYTYNQGQQPEPTTLTVEEVLDFRFPSLYSPLYGWQSPLGSAWMQASLSSKFLDYENSLIDNRARPDVIISRRGAVGGLDEDESKRLRKEYDRLFKGPGNGKALIDNIEVTPLNYTPHDLGPLQIREETVREICGALGIPEPLYKGNAATYANFETALLQHAKLGTLPRLHLIETTLNSQFISRFNDDSLFLAFDNPIPDDQESADQRRIEAIDVSQINEVRAWAGMEAIAGGDTLVMDHRSKLIAGQAANDPNDLAPLDTTEDEDVDEDIGDEVEEDDTTNPPDIGEDENEKSFDVEAFLKINDAIASGKLSRAMAINFVSRSYGIPEADAKAMIQDKPKATKAISPCNCATKGIDRSERDASKLEPILHGLFAKQRIDVLKQIKGSKAITKSLPDTFSDIDEWDRDFANEVKPVMELWAEESAHKTLTRVGAAPDKFSVVSPKLNEAVDKASYAFAQSTNRTTSMQLNDALTMLREEIRQGLFEGDTVRELTKRVNEVFDNAESYRAERIARSEASRAEHMGQRLAAQESGVVSGFKWLASSDACPICQDFADQEIAADGSFQDGEGYDQIDTPPAHPNCECAMVEIIKDEGQDNENA